MKHAAIIFCWIIVVAAGVFLRFDDLGARPFHADEATGARITAQRMEEGGSRFDPAHYHGPLLGTLAIPLCEMRGESSWREMSKSTLRALPALAGSLLVLVPLLWRRRFGDAPMLLSAAMLATSPLLVYYSRMFIHETLLVLFGMLALLSLTKIPRWGVPGFLIGLMFATKESFAISIIAWAGAGLLVAMENRKSLDRATLLGAWREYRMPVAVSLIAFTATAAGFYTDGFTRPQGAIDAIRTFFVYETVAGHDKGFGYYLQLLTIPRKSAGVWWFETPVLLLALLAYGSTFRSSSAVAKWRPVIHFLAYAAAGHFVIYSLIAYKTPWLACLPWAHVCLLAGFGIVGFSTLRTPLKLALALLVSGCLFTQFRLSRQATGRFASDDRNPYAYVPTRNDVERLEAWLARLRAAGPVGALEPAAVIGSDYWPLPWYLRGFEKIGYWKSPPADLIDMPVVLAMPESTDEVLQALEPTHVLLPRGLRAGVAVDLYLRKDIWDRWMNADSP